MKKSSRRKRLLRPKTGRYKRRESEAQNNEKEASAPTLPVEAEDLHGDGVSFDHRADGVSVDTVITTPSSMLSSDHDYVCSTSSIADTQHETSHCKPEQETQRCPDNNLQDNLQDLLLQMKVKVEVFRPPGCMVIVDCEKLHVIFMCLQNGACVQRSVVYNPSGNVEIFVHSKPVDCDIFTDKLDPPMPLDRDSLNSHVDRVVSIVNEVSKKAICSGYDHIKYEPVWSSCPFGTIDKNLFQECRYVETFRSLNCSMLVSGRTWRCSACQNMYGPLRRRLQAAAEEKRHRNTGNVFLTEEQRLTKLKELRNEADNLKKEKYRLHERMQTVIKKNGVMIDSSLSDDLSEIMSKSAISPAQSIFLQQQVKASQQKNASGMRWHPTRIRFALALHLTSPTAYEMVRQTGMVKLPSSRTLFDYAHVKRTEEGIDEVVLESLESRVNKFSEPHKKFHVLMADEIYISQNLVFQKSSGKLLGYTSLDDIDRELKHLEDWIDATSAIELQETIASKVLVFMVKGVSNGVKEVVASFAVSSLSAMQLKDWTWHVIGVLEKHGIAVVCFVCDGSSVNRAFIRKHKPATVHESGVVFDTWNRATRDRKLYFIADVPHLLKTIRNCLLNSRWDKKPSRRRMVKNKKRISWDYVIKLYELKKNKSLRKSYKLNAQNVYPDSYARMKVSLAGQVLSATVSKDMESQGWEDAEETIKFIHLVNNWFDCLNGAHTTQGKRKRNENLNPYTSKEDNRFSVLENFLEYLDEWQHEAEKVNQSINASVNVENSRNLDSPDCDTSDIESAAYNSEKDTPFAKRILSRETLEGIRMTTLAFKPLVHMLLDNGVKFINARIFTQDPLEQHFSRVRAGQVGSTNPNVAQVLIRNRALHTIGQLGIRKRKGNSGEGGNKVIVTSEPLPKRQSKKIPRFSSIRE